MLPFPVLSPLLVFSFCDFCLLALDFTTCVWLSVLPFILLTCVSPALPLPGFARCSGHGGFCSAGFFLHGRLCLAAWSVLPRLSASSSSFVSVLFPIWLFVYVPFDDASC